MENHVVFRCSGDSPAIFSKRASCIRLVQATEALLLPTAIRIRHVKLGIFRRRPLLLLIMSSSELARSVHHSIIAAATRPIEVTHRSFASVELRHLSMDLPERYPATVDPKGPGLPRRVEQAVWHFSGPRDPITLHNIRPQRLRDGNLTTIGSCRCITAYGNGKL